MQVTFNSEQMLHLSVTPSMKSWSILVGVMSIGIGAAYYSPDDHVLLKLAYLAGCLFLGLTFLDDWEDCVIDKRKKLITLTRKTWLESLLSKCTDSKTLVLESNSVMAVHLIPAHKSKNVHKVGLVLRSGSTIPISETTSGSRSEQESIARCVRQILCLDRIETLREFWDDSDEDNQSVSSSVQVESLNSSIVMDMEPKDEENIRNRWQNERHLQPVDEDSDSSSSSSSLNEEYLADNL